MAETIFSKIIAKEIPAKVEYEDEQYLVIHDIQPQAPVHLLVIPKQHLATLSDCTDQHAAVLGRMLALAPKLAAEHGIAVQQGPDGERSGGYKALINAGPDGGQEVYHLHLHVYGGPRPWRGLGT